MMTGIIAAWREVRAIVLGLAAFGVIAALFKLYRWALLALGLLGGIFYFFRDPDRTASATGIESILSPADGTVISIDQTHEPHFFNGPAQRIIIFLSLFDVHMQRAPYPGTVQLTRYQSGGFLPAFLMNAEANESHLTGFSTAHGPVGVVQIAGLLARRIVFWPNLGDELNRGERLGLIKFGSRVDLLLPANAEILVAVGQKVSGGQTVMARWRN